MSRRLRTVAAVAILVAVGVAASGCVPEVPESPTVDATPAPAWATEAAQVAADLPRLPGPYAGDTRLAEGVAPPTNSWVGAAVFGGGERPVYTGVLAVRPTASSFEVGLPRVAITPSSVFGSFIADLRFDVPGSSTVLSRIDALSADFRYSTADAEVGTLTLAQGWPYAFYRATTAQEIGLGGATPTETSSGVWRTEVNGVAYLVVGTDAVLGGSGFSVAAGGSLAVLALPSGAGSDVIDRLVAGAVPLTGTEATTRVESESVATTFHFDVDQDTVFAARPHQQISTGLLGAAYDTIYGPSTLVGGRDFTFEVPRVEPVAGLDVDSLTDDEKDTVRAQIAVDAERPFVATDSYSGGKELYRAAMLYRLAVDLGQDDVAATLKSGIEQELDLWLDPRGCQGRSDRCFVYDPVLGGITGRAPAYGSDEFNDHHFHYGYFLYALGVVAQGDPDLVERYRPMADVIALDLAAPVAVPGFPARRVFDEYEGHSWASGTVPFVDGNNQESASEAVNAWAGLALWAEASDQDDQRAEAEALLSVETETARRYWLGAEMPTGMTAPFFALNWGGKRDYATFFDASPSAILGIELIPMSPSTAFLPDTERRAALVSGVMDAGTLELPLIDYVIMLQATVDPAAALQNARALPDARIDSANSRSYLLAWILTHD
ncbi:hypothetical protein CSIV_16835 [Microbacterium sp. CSI-V]|uniref:glycosyl hydrolase n=1 Tax=unclassified Microbacterium TaxID=2609290 RepID=UPI00097C11D5|nr:glycosyl hydrolase [Microbacterium sp. CSI-V]ONI63076.1 hypothetical protein CSIV_16835 [Microbacterium sp. CSI-V]